MRVSPYGRRPEDGGVLRSPRSLRVRCGFRRDLFVSNLVSVDSKPTTGLSCSVVCPV